MVLNILMLSFNLIFLPMGFSIKLPVLIPLNRIVSQKGSTDMLLKLVLLLYQAHLPLNFWLYAFTATIYLINRLPSFVLGFQTPLEKLFSKTPSVQALKSFGCACYPFLRPYNKHKLQPRSTPCVFLGYPPLSKGYICLDPASNSIYIVCVMFCLMRLFFLLPLILVFLFLLPWLIGCLLLCPLLLLLIFLHIFILLPLLPLPQILS